MHLFSNSEEAAAKDLPYYSTTSIFNIPSWESTLFVTKHNYYEGSNYELTLYDYEGNQVLPTFSYIGDYSILESAHMLCMIDSSLKDNSYESQCRSYFIKMGQTKEILSFRHAPIFQYRFSYDNELLFLFSRGFEKDKPGVFEAIETPFSLSVVLTIVDLNGLVIKEERFYK